jgi:hypothetical protein
MSTDLLRKLPNMEQTERFIDALFTLESDSQITHLELDMVVRLE